MLHTIGEFLRDLVSPPPFTDAPVRTPGHDKDVSELEERLEELELRISTLERNVRAIHRVIVIEELNCKEEHGHHE